jgi:hypothetical protein
MGKYGLVELHSQNDANQEEEETFSSGYCGEGAGSRANWRPSAGTDCSEPEEEKKISREAQAHARQIA